MITLGAYCHHVHCRRNKQTCTRRELSFKSLTFPHAKASSIVLMNPNWTICQDFTRIINVLFLKIYLAINGKMLKGYKELIHENTTTIHTYITTNMRNSKSHHTNYLRNCIYTSKRRRKPTHSFSKLCISSASLPHLTEPHVYICLP